MTNEQADSPTSRRFVHLSLTEIRRALGQARAFEGFFQLGPDRVAALLGFFPLLAEDEGNILRR